VLKHIRRATTAAQVVALAVVCEPLMAAAPSGRVADMACEAGLSDLLPRLLAGAVQGGELAMGLAVCRLVCGWRGAGGCWGF
jgi:hypothetical protein